MSCTVRWLRIVVWVPAVSTAAASCSGGAIATMNIPSDDGASSETSRDASGEEPTEAGTVEDGGPAKRTGKNYRTSYAPVNCAALCGRTASSLETSCGKPYPGESYVGRASYRGSSGSVLLADCDAVPPEFVTDNHGVPGAASLNTVICACDTPYIPVEGDKDVRATCTEVCGADDLACRSDVPWESDDHREITSGGGQAYYSTGAADLERMLSCDGAVDATVSTGGSTSKLARYSCGCVDE